MKLRHILVSVAAAGALLVGTTAAAGATSGATANRLSGSDRYVTARAVATATFTKATVALLASGTSYPDALAAAYLSGAAQAPLLLTTPQGLTPGITDTLKALQVSGVDIVGGTVAVNDQVVTDLQNAGYTVNRLAGATRYETAKKVAELLPKEAVGTFGAGPAVILATGDSFADALTAGVMSASQGMPMLLTTGASLNADAKAAMTDLGIKQVLVVGGTSAVPQSVADEITGMGIAVQRIAGANRQATAVEVAKVEKLNLAYPLNRVELARGDDFADALAGATRGGHVFAPVLLTHDMSTLGSETRNYIAANASTIGTVDVLGGTSSIPDAVANDALAAARGQ